MNPYANHYTWNKPFRKRRWKKFRELRLEALESREMFSTVVDAAIPATTEMEALTSPVEWHAPQTPTVAKPSTEFSPAAIPVEAAVSVEPVSPEETGEGFAPLLPDAVNQVVSASDWLADRNMAATSPSQQFEDGGIPSTLKIPGIPGGDTGGAAGYNGGGRLPLSIAGFNGYGNAYYLDINDETLPRIVWLYAQYYRNQVRLVPTHVALNRPEVQVQTNLYFDGARMTEDVYNLIPEQPADQEKTDEEIIPAPPKKTGKSEKPDTEKPKATTDETLEKDLPKTLDDLPPLEEEPPKEPAKPQETPKKPEKPEPPDDRESPPPPPPLETSNVSRPAKRLPDTPAKNGDPATG
ncbi:MAG: hypothetical protein Q4D98_12485 [Planctomycetia bacterium]|nr:hypothetical protein [Planctomycetia bacterium]